MVIYLDMPIEISQKLMTSRYNGDEDKKDVHEADVSFLKQCRNAALYAAENQGWTVINCSDGDNPYSIDEIHNKIMECIKEKIMNI